MAISPAQRRAVAKYNAANYDRVELRLPKGRKAEVEAHAQEVGETINGYVNSLIRDDMGVSTEEWGKESSTKTLQLSKIRRFLDDYGYKLMKKHPGLDSWCIEERDTHIHVAGYDGGWDEPGLTLEEVQEMIDNDQFYRHS